MNNYFCWRLTAAIPACMVVLIAQAGAEIKVRLSVKFINDSTGTPPPGAFGNATGFAQEITRGNQILDDTARGYSLQVVEYLSIQPPAPAGGPVNRTCGTQNGMAVVTCSNTAGLQACMLVQGPGIPANTVILSIVPNTSFTMSANATAANGSAALTMSFSPDTWYIIPARAKRAVIEAAALANQAAWSWNANAINIYVNNSSSGQCSFVGNGLSISLGSSFGTGTVLHEVGHFFNLQHTHTGDYADQPGFNNPGFVYGLSHVADGDGEEETAPDNPNISARDQLSNALYGVNFNSLTDLGKARINSAFDNVMSYHEEDVLLPSQMDLWTKFANAQRAPFTTGRSWFVSWGGADGNTGLEVNQSFMSLQRSIDAVGGGDDMILLRGGPYTLPSGTLTKPCTLTATYGPVTITRP